jgi:hypothetical protein
LARLDPTIPILPCGTALALRQKIAITEPITNAMHHTMEIGVHDDFIMEIFHCLYLSLTAEAT